ncbi:hypothetical protein LSCM4_07067 [Leishmania orientalis]|uniref:Uncharacterized protein n=1 Tax=Leishmania orientalis TaxID=2249476 RepID=A0A836KNX1_9TRYP|nr:hypothetical protein LSCM4_07067 [Leishmania orientalis]
MQAYIDSICNRAPPSTAPQVRATKSALLLQSHREAKRRQLDQARSNGSITWLKHSRRLTRAPAARWPAQACPVGPPPRPRPCRSQSSGTYDELTQTPVASSVAAAVSPWHPLFTSASPSPVTSPSRQQQQPRARRTSKEKDKADDTREAHGPPLSHAVGAEGSTSVSAAARDDRRLYDAISDNGESGCREVADAVRASVTQRGSCVVPSPNLPQRPAWTLWNPPPHGGHRHVVQGDAASLLQTPSRLRCPAPSCTSPVPSMRAESKLPCALRASTARLVTSSSAPTRSSTSALSGQTHTSLSRLVDRSDPQRSCRPVSAPQQQQPARVHSTCESYYSNGPHTTDAEAAARTQRWPLSSPSRPSLSSLISSGSFGRGPEAVMRRRAEHSLKVMQQEGHPRTRLSATAPRETSSFTKLSQQANQPQPGADYRWRDVHNCSLRDLQEGLYTRLQRRLNNLATLPFSSTSPTNSKAAARSDPSTPLLADMDAAVRLWRDTRVALRQQMQHRSGICTQQHSAPPRGRWPNGEENEEGVVVDGVARRILAERAASRAYLLAGAAAAHSKESTH